MALGAVPVLTGMEYEGYKVYGQFSDGLVMVQKDGSFGFADKSGNIVIPLIYENADSFSDGLASVKKGGHVGFIDKSGTEIVPLIYDYAHAFVDGLALVRKNGK